MAVLRALSMMTFLGCGAFSAPGDQDGGPPHGGPYAGHPLVGTWEIRVPVPSRGAALRQRTFGANGIAYVHDEAPRETPGCAFVSDITDQPWRPAGAGAQGTCDILPGMTEAYTRDVCSGSVVAGSERRTIRMSTSGYAITYRITGSTLHLESAETPGVGEDWQRVP